MIFHTIYTFTIGQFAELIETNNINLVKRINIWIPKKIIKKAYHKLIADHNINSNKDKIQDLIESDFEKISVRYKLLRLELLSKMIRIYYQTIDKEILQTIKESFKEYFKYEPTEEDFVKVKKEQELLIDRASQTFKDEKNNNVDYDFETQIIALENAISPITLRDKKLYTYPKYVDSALNKINNNG